MRTPTHWPRAIILVDMNAFFASVEQRDCPELRGRPVAVTNGEQGSCVITCSYEARAYGVKTGMRLREAKQICPGLIRRPARPERYAKISAQIMHVLTEITPDVEVFSVDEAFLDVTHCQSLWGDPVCMAKMVKQKVLEVSGILCSVGLSGDKTTAKYAAKLQKPNGFTVIAPWEAAERLSQVPVTELCGIAKGVGNFLARYGVYLCGDMHKLPISILAKRFGNIGRRIWYMCQGEDPDPVHMSIPAAKSMGHGKVLPPKMRDERVVKIYLQHMSERLASRLRCNKLQAQCFSVGLRSAQLGWLGDKYKHMAPTDDGAVIYDLCLDMLNECWHGEVVMQVQVTALDPRPAKQQQDMFATIDEQRIKLNQVMDYINQRFGHFTLSPAALLERSKMPNVIAPAWKPTGHRQTI